MNPQKVIAIILIALGIVVLAYSGISFTSRGKDVNVLGMKFETTERHFIPPVAGALALAGGLVLLVVGSKKSLN
jgi:drug/metabolite transporter (DMT)-like permease